MYLEDLPPQCPPAEAEDGNYGVLWRVKTSTSLDVCPSDFESSAKQGKPCPPKVDLCRWSSCSLFETEHGVTSLKKLPKFKGKGHFSLSISRGVGRALRGSGGHVDFWFYATVDPSSLVLKNG